MLIVDLEINRSGPLDILTLMRAKGSSFMIHMGIPALMVEDTEVTNL